MSNNRVEYLALAGYDLKDHPIGLPEKRLKQFLTAAGIPHEELGAGVSLATNERDAEIGFQATEQECKMIELFCEHGAEDVWLIMKMDEAE